MDPAWASAPWVVARSTDSESTDGRVARGQRTRRKVAEALLDLIREGDLEPTGKAIASRAGVSLRLLFHHFADINDLYRMAATVQYERYWADLPIPPSKLALPTRIAYVVRERARLYEEISPVRWAGIRRAATSPELTATLVATDLLLRENLAAAFAAEFNALPTKESQELLSSVDAATCWEVWEHMRRGSALTLAGARQSMIRTVTALFTAATAAAAAQAAAAAL
jgi:AcrR family transcriptional regulator